VYSPLELRALEYIKGAVSSELSRHLISTRDFALHLNVLHQLGLDEDRIALAALCHDLARECPVEEMERQLWAKGIDPVSYGFVNPILLHSVLSVEIARDEIGVDDEEVLDAIRWHSTGRAGMSLLAKLIFVADKVEPSRSYPGVEELRALAVADPIGAFPRILGKLINWLIAELKPIDYNSILAYNEAVAGG